MSGPSRFIAIGALLIGGFGSVPSHATDVSPAPASNHLQGDALVIEVLQANPGLAALEAAVQEAAARVKPAGALDDPRLSYETAPRTWGSQIGDRHNVQVSQSVPWPGTLGRRAVAAEHRREAAGHRLAAARLEVAALARTAYAEWYFVHRALAINTDNLAVLADLKASAETLYGAGRTGQQDVLRAERERNHLLHQQIVYQSQRTSLRAQINALLNRPATQALPPPGELVEPASLPSPERLQAAAARRHPELRDLQARVAAGDVEVELAQKAFYPNINVMTGYNTMWNDSEMQWTVGVGISVPLDRSRRRADRDAAEAARLRAQWGLADRRGRLLAELESVWAEVDKSRHVIELYRERLVPLARETLNASLAAYHSGSGSFLEVIEAEQETLRAELGLARARANYARHLAELDRWAGGELLPANRSSNTVSFGDTPHE